MPIDVAVSTFACGAGIATGPDVLVKVVATRGVADDTTHNLFSCARGVSMEPETIRTAVVDFVRRIAENVEWEGDYSLELKLEDGREVEVIMDPGFVCFLRPVKELDPESNDLYGRFAISLFEPEIVWTDLLKVASPLSTKLGSVDDVVDNDQRHEQARQSAEEE